MVIRQLNGHSALSRRLERLEVVASTRTAELDERERAVQEWLSLPAALQRYFGTCDPKLHRDAHGGSDVYRLYGYAVNRVRRNEEAVVYVAGWMLRFAWHCLGGVRKREAGQNTCHVGRCAHCDVAARELLGSSVGDLHALWTADPEGLVWVDLWREQGTRDRAILAAARVFEPEIELLESAGATLVASD